MLCQFENYLRTCSKETKELSKKKSKEHHDELMERFIGMEGLLQENFDIEASVADKNIVYYLAGFLCYKARKIFACKKCVESLSAPSLSTEYSKMVEIMNLGPLHYATEKFYYLLLAIEETITPLLKDCNIYGDIILECIRTLPNMDIAGLGCSAEGHKYELLCALIPYYITMRIHFYAKGINCRLGRGKATKNKRKESKLIS